MHGFGLDDLHAVAVQIPDEPDDEEGDHEERQDDGFVGFEVAHFASRLG